MIISHATTNFRGEKKTSEGSSDNRTQISLIDISRAYFNAKTDESDPVYVQLPPEAGANENECAFLRLYVRHSQGR